jgi:NAD(P)-dependent dehydrogenase (short-subunit alcohol dehydrogenase family)
VFANAGIGGRTSYLEEQLDDQGELLEPPSQTYDVNLRGAVNTCYLGQHYIRKQLAASSSAANGSSEGNGREDYSILLIASCSSFQRFSLVDYAVTKHAVLGYARGIYSVFHKAGIPIRVNSLAPSWTATGLAPDGVLEAAQIPYQKPTVVARSAALLMADPTRDGECIYSSQGRYREVDNAILLPCVDTIINGEEEAHDKSLTTIMEYGAKLRAARNAQSAA